MRKFDWFYVFLLMAFAVGRLVQKLMADSGGIASRFGPVILAVLLVTGFIGYTKQCPILKRWFWRVIFIVLAFASAGLVVLALYLILTVGSTQYAISGVIVLSLALAYPALYAMYQYAFCLPSIWSLKR